VIHTRTGPHVY